MVLGTHNISGVVASVVINILVDICVVRDTMAGVVIPALLGLNAQMPVQTASNAKAVTIFSFFFVFLFFFVLC
jgi:hypothetical protein